MGTQAVADSSGAAVPARGVWFTPGALATILRLKEDGMSLQKMAAGQTPSSQGIPCRLDQGSYHLSLCKGLLRIRPVGSLLQKAHHAKSVVVDASAANTTATIIEAEHHMACDNLCL